MDYLNYPMPPVNDPFLLAAASNFAVGGTVLVVALLAIERFAARWSGRAALIAAIGLGVAALVTGPWLRLWDLAIPGTLLAGAALASLVVRTSVFRGALQVATRPLAFGSTVLAACAAAAVFVQIASRFPSDEFNVPMPVGTEFHMVEGLVALTDLGQTLPLIAYDEDDALAETELAYLGDARFRNQIIRLAAPTPVCNCHGWVYAGGRFAIQSRYIPELLDDNGYVEVQQARADDLVIYRGESGAVEHTGVVRMVGADGLILVESKWGPLGVYLHPVGAQPYGTGHKYYRSSRAGHLVTIVPQSSAPESELPLLAGLPAGTSAELDTALSANRSKPGERKVFERPTLRVPGQRRT